MSRIEPGNGWLSRAARRRMLASWFSRQHRGPGAVEGLPVRHPGQLGGERVGQPGQVDPAFAVLGDRRPVGDAGADDRAVPERRQLREQPRHRIQAAGRAQVPETVTAHRAPASRSCRSSSSPPRAGPRPHRPSRRGPAWSARVRDPSRRDTTHSGVPASSSAVAWLCRNQCGVQPGGPIPLLAQRRGLVPDGPLPQRGQQRRPLQVHQQRRSPRSPEARARRRWQARWVR